MDTKFVLNQLPTLFQGLNGVSMSSDGAALAMQGAAYSANVFKLAASSSLDIAEYNVGLAQINYERQQEAMAKEYTKLVTSNRSAYSTSGFSYGSGSYLAVQNKVQNQLENQLIQQKNNLLIQKQNIRYEGQAASVGYENQSKAAQYQGQVAQYQASVQQTRSIGGLFQNAFSLFTS